MNRYRFTLTQFAIAFISFGVLLCAALLYAEVTPDVGFWRTVYTIWVTAALVTPALCAFALPQTERTRAVWLLWWTFSFIAYIVHMLYAVFYVYEGSFQKFLAGQGIFPAVNNAIFTAWWALDVALAWFYKLEARWVHLQRVWGHWYIGLTFVASTVFLKHGFINVIGVILTVSTAICIMIRIDARRRAGAGAKVAEPALQPNVT